MRIKGEVLWIVMLLLAILAMGMLFIASQQLQFMRTNQWHDMAIRIDYETDKALSEFLVSPLQFPVDAIPMDAIDVWPNAALLDWQRCNRGYHQFYEWEGEIHMVMEMLSNEQTIYRLNVLGYHPSGILMKKQCVIGCEKGMCRRLSCIMW